MNRRNTLVNVGLTVVCTLAVSASGAIFGNNLMAEAPTADLSTRVVPLIGQSNLRDLGGYGTSDGRTVKKGVLYRSGELHKLSDDDVKTLKKLGIKTVVNFLTPEEIEKRGRDRLPVGVREVPQPIVGGVAGDLTRAASKARETGDFSQLPVEINPEIHRLLIDAGSEQYRALILEIGNGANLPLVFHCSHGIHRTGTASALVLSLLGVPWETVREDYLLSNTTRKTEVQKRLSELRNLAAKKQGVKPEQVDTTNMEAFYILDGSYIDASLDEIVNKYGSVDDYAKKGLRLTEEDLDRLRNALLE